MKNIKIKIEQENLPVIPFQAPMSPNAKPIEPRCNFSFEAEFNGLGGALLFHNELGTFIQEFKSKFNI